MLMMYSFDLHVTQFAFISHETMCFFLIFMQFLFVKQDKFGISNSFLRTLGRNGLRCHMMMHPDHLWNYLTFCCLLCSFYFCCKFHIVNWCNFGFLPEASFGLRVLSLPACVCMCVCPCVRQSWACPCDNSSTVQARITKFGSEM